MSNSLCELAMHNILNISKMQIKKIALQYKYKANIFFIYMFYQYDFKYSTGLLGDVLHIGIFHQFGRTSYFCKFLIVARKFNMSFLGLSSSISLRYFSHPRMKFPSLSVNPLPLAANDEWRSRLYILRVIVSSIAFSRFLPLLPILG